MESYAKLANIARSKGYEVVSHNVDWKKPLHPQIFPVAKDDVIFGFSLGAILAWFVAQDYPCRQVILASMQPLSSFADTKIKQAFIDLAGTEFTEDLIVHIKSEHKAEKQVILYGDKEGEKGDILVANTGHEMNDSYLEEVGKLL
ncbi:MAG: hypothetical protein A2723_02275 [Candidatus Zambryskibacteria bacterium RIFCSPHIGHO2_01_FULL_52_18]|nr:MAG: hypothetical protein A2723_02275 [Candidatus Zambryskibacteria bacterium RIFCSPHIGHO2_01_FULL_52_18]